MEVFKITLEKFSNNLRASGFAARWNSKGNHVIYTSASRALACLENVVHRSGEGLNKDFRVMIINIPAKVSIEEISLSGLPQKWELYENSFLTRAIGDKWYIKNSSAILKIPSAIIPKEFNFIINPNNPDFKFIKLKSVEEFIFDKRIKP